MMDTGKLKQSSRRVSELPAIRGPYRGLIIILPKNNDFTEFKELYPSLTFEHPNFYFSKSDKHKCIIYYKYPYDVATLLSKHQGRGDLKLSIYYDELTKTLQSDVLYVVTKNVDNLLAKIEQLNGTIIHKAKIGFQIQFEDFKMTAIAHEELRKDFSVKFAYKSEVNKYRNPIQITKENEEKYQLKKDIELLIKKYKKNSENQEFKVELEGIRKRQKNIIYERIRRAGENLDFADISWNAGNDSSDSVDDEEKEEEARECNPDNIFEELKKLYNNL